MATTDKKVSTVALRRARLRRFIITQADEICEENGGGDNGFEAATVENIAERSQISVRTFFRYFDTRLDAIFLDYGEIIPEQIRCINARIGQMPLFRAAVQGLLDHTRDFMSEPANRRRLHRSLMSRHFVERRAYWRQHARQQISEALMPYCADRENARLRASMLAGCVIATLDSGLETWAQDTASDAVESIREAADLLPEVLVV